MKLGAFPRLDRGQQRRLAIVVLGIAAVGFALAALAVRVTAMRSLRDTGPNWSFPSRVFSDGVALEPGHAVPAPYLAAELRARGYVEVPRPPRDPGSWSRSGDDFEIVLRGFPDAPDPLGSGGPERVALRIVDGRIAAVARRGAVPGASAPDLSHPPRLEPALVSTLFAPDRVWRSYVELERVPAAVQDAVIASEDRRFYGHLGVDLRANLRAVVRNVRSGGVREGGSTITQQLARGLFLGRERTLFRKLLEMPLAVALEVLLTKQQILEMYLNSVYWGQAEGFGVGGVAEAARWYFDAPVESLGVAEGAMLAAMIPAPNALDPFRAPSEVRERRNRVLAVMVETGALDPARGAAIQHTPLGLRRGRAPIERHPSYAGYVRSIVERELPRRAATQFGLAIFTTMDLGWQQIAEHEVPAQLARLDPGRRRHPLQGALVAIEPVTGAVRAMVGGRAPSPGDYNRAYQARRQTGSAIKPIVYAAAFANGRGSLTPASCVADTPFTLGRGRHAWTPRNFGDSYHRQVTLAKALELSLNVATTNLVQMIGPDQVAAVAADFGLGRLQPVPSIGLGSNEVSLMDLTAAYAAFLDRGMWREPSPIRVIVDARGARVHRPEGAAHQAISEGVAALMTALLQNVVRVGVAAPLRTVYGFDRPVGGKTGTTDNYHDGWFVGFTPDVVAGAWVGFDRPRSIGRQAARSALPLWARSVGRMLEGFPRTAFALESQVEWVDIEPWTGERSDSLCARESVPFLRGTAPTWFCSNRDPWGYDTLGYDTLGITDSAWIEPEPEPDDTLESSEPDSAAFDVPRGEPEPDSGAVPPP